MVLVPFPFTDLSTSKLRPAVIVGIDGSADDAVFAFVGSRQVTQIGSSEVAVVPNHPEFSLTGLVTSSKVRTAKLVTLSRSLVRRWLGRLGPLLIADLDRALVATLAINMVPYRENGRRDERSRLLRLHGAGGVPALLADLAVEDSG